MAERRMFARSVIGSARFLKIPATARLLYYDLGMSADDGIVEAFSVMRTTGASEDDLRILASKGFVRVLNEDFVSYILDWEKNNLIRKDRYHPSIYADIKDTECNVLSESEHLPLSNGQPVVNQRLTEVSIGKVSIGKDSIGRGADKPPPQAPFDFQAVQELYNCYCPSLPRCTKLTEKRKRVIRSCVKEKFTMEDFEVAFKKAEASSFLTGKKSGATFRAGFDWLTNPSNLAKVLEGNYDDMEEKHNGKNESKPLWTVGTTV